MLISFVRTKASAMAQDQGEGTVDFGLGTEMAKVVSHAAAEAPAKRFYERTWFGFWHKLSPDFTVAAGESDIRVGIRRMLRALEK